MKRTAIAKCPPPHLYVTADVADFDQVSMRHWAEEGFDVQYISLGSDEKSYRHKLQHLADDFETEDSYAVVAYGRTASICLELFAEPEPRLCALVAYYPENIVSPTTKFPPSVKVVVHLAASQHFGPSFASYTYENAMPGFAEHDRAEYDKVAARIAWSRSLHVIKKAFGAELDLERIWEEHVDLEFAQRNADATMETMVAHPYVNHVPTCTGGTGQRDLHRFYRDFFIPSNPPSLKIRLTSRTIGVDRVVDEMNVSFKHTQEIPWMLPGVPPTNKAVEVALVSVVCIRGDKLYHEHIYWDQACVLVQIGLLDPLMVPQALKAQGMQRLPVVGVESARKVLDEHSVPSNGLVNGW